VICLWRDNSRWSVVAAVGTRVESSGEKRVNAGFRLGVLGLLAVTVDGEGVELPKSKKTRALLVHLALAGRPVLRERLCELFWDAPDDPRGSLRWSLSKLRPIVNAGGVERLAASADAVGWSGAPEDVDLHAVEQATAAGLDSLPLTDLAALANMFRGDLAEGLDLPEHDGYQRWLAAERERVRGQRANVLRALLDRLEAAPAEALPHAGALIELEPYDESAHVRIVALHRRLGREKEARQAYETGLRAMREIGRSTAALDAAWRGGSAQPAHGDKPPLAQEIRFCRGRDGVRIAYATVGSGPPLVKAANWLNHLERDWESPVFRHVLRHFALEHTLVRYDARGNGLSDWDAEDFSFDAMVSDLEAVVEAAGLASQHFPLVGMCQGCAVSIEYAIRHPDRVSKLVLYSGYARGWWLNGSLEDRADIEAMLTLMRSCWGRDNPAFRQLFSSMLFPDGTTEQFDWFNEAQRVTTTGENAVKPSLAHGLTDIRDRLALVTVPTLVLHLREDAAISYERGRELAAGIPGARFVTLEGRNHFFLEHEPAWGRFREEVSRFLAD
jgi:DNA-binding SARP family transcriptional activator/pimeloyl-ACP methyl ester carboxylesterase